MLEIGIIKDTHSTVSFEGVIILNKTEWQDALMHNYNLNSRYIL